MGDDILRQKVVPRRIDQPILEKMFRDGMKKKNTLQPLAVNIRCRFNNLVNCNTPCKKDVREPPAWCKRWRKYNKYLLPKNMK